MADPYFDNVSLLLPMLGDNGGTVFGDASPTPKTVTPTGVTISTTQSQYYGSSGYFAGTSNKLDVADSSDFDLPGDFTLEFWTRPASFSAAPNGGQRCPFSFAGTGSLGTATPGILISVAGTLQWYTNTSVLTATANLTLNTWTHIAYVRLGTTLTIYLGGTARGSATYSTSVSPPGLLVGRSYSTYGDYSGYLQDLRLTKGVARYTDTFTPPDPLGTAYSVSGTVLDTNGDPCSRTIYLYSQATGALLSSTTSDAVTGAYSFTTYNQNEVFRVVVADEPTLYNHIIDRIIPG